MGEKITRWVAEKKEEAMSWDAGKCWKNLEREREKELKIGMRVICFVILGWFQGLERLVFHKRISG